MPDAEDVLGRAVSSRTLDLTAVNHAARLAAEVGTSRASVEYSPARFHGYETLCAPSPRCSGSHRRGHGRSLRRARHLARCPRRKRVRGDSVGWRGPDHASARIPGSRIADRRVCIGDGEWEDGVAWEAAAARALSSRCVPEAAGAERPWRLLMDVGASDASATSGNFEMSSVLVAVGGALARVTSVNDARRDELCAAIEQKLKGSTRARASGLDLLRAVLGAPKQPFPHSAIALSVRWALHAVSSAKVSSKPMDSNSDARGVNGEGAVSYAHRLVVSVAAVLVSAARYLAVSDLQPFKMVGLSLAWRQALTWRRDVDHPETLQCAPLGAT